MQKFMITAIAALLMGGSADATELESAIRDLVQERGFNCAELLSVDRTLDDEHGQNYMVTCFFSGRGATYRMTIQPNRNILIKLERSY